MFEEDLRAEVARVRSECEERIAHLERQVGERVTNAEIAAQCLSPRQYGYPEIVVSGGATVTVQFGGEYDVPETMLYGLPETIQKWGGIERDFVLESLVVDDVAAAHFSVTQIILGGTTLWRYGVEIPASRFAESEPRVRFDELVRKGFWVTVQIRNTMQEAQSLSLRIVGRERKA